MPALVAGIHVFRSPMPRRRRSRRVWAWWQRPLIPTFPRKWGEGAQRRIARTVRHCEPTDPGRSGRPDDKLREAIQAEVWLWIASSLAPRNDAGAVY